MSPSIFYNLAKQRFCKGVVVDVGQDCFAMKAIPFLNDLKYQETSEQVKTQDLPVAE